MVNRFVGHYAFQGHSWKRSGFLDFRIHRKHTALGIPLSDSSSHPRSVHIGWPSSLFGKLASRCSSRALLEEAQKSFLIEFSQGVPGHVALYHIVYGSRAPARDRHCSVGKRSWIILPFSACWDNAKLGSVIHECISSWQPYLESLGIEFDMPGISWRLGSSHLFRRISRM